MEVGFLDGTASDFQWRPLVREVLNLRVIIRAWYLQNKYIY